MHDASVLTRPTNALHEHMHGTSSLSLDVYVSGDKPVIRLYLRSYYVRRPGWVGVFLGKTGVGTAGVA